MPYTKQELENVDFYQGFVNRLRNKYLRERKSLAKVNFQAMSIFRYYIHKIYSLNYPNY